MEVERDLNEAAAMQSGLSEEEKQQHIAEVNELKGEIASQAAATARLRHSLEQRSDIIERLTANDVHQQDKINLLKVSSLSSPACHHLIVPLHLYISRPLYCLRTSSRTALVLLQDTAGKLTNMFVKCFCSI